MGKGSERMTKKFQWIIAGLVLVLLNIGVSSILADAPVPGRAEVRFLEGMMDHHQMALDMANGCLTKATDDAVRSLCQNILGAQSAEIQQMHEWLLNWYNVDMMPFTCRSGFWSAILKEQATPNSVRLHKRSLTIRAQRFR